MTLPDHLRLVAGRRVSRLVPATSDKRLLFSATGGRDRTTLALPAA